MKERKKSCSLGKLLSDVVLAEMDKQQENEDGFIIDQKSIDEYLIANGYEKTIPLSELYNHLVKEGFGKTCGYLVSFHDEMIECAGEFLKFLHSK